MNSVFDPSLLYDGANNSSDKVIQQPSYLVKAFTDLIQAKFLAEWFARLHSFAYFVLAANSLLCYWVNIEKTETMLLSPYDISKEIRNIVHYI